MMRRPKAMKEIARSLRRLRAAVAKALADSRLHLARVNRSIADTAPDLSDLNLQPQADATPSSANQEGS
jgi:hypothetical protein